ncbi:hypothetical protein HY571_02075 [Candidatus Micrarchaeota archaeon]|nr:hypothetical protein [Candidatus Micrarchaeota archaeon]
MTKFTFLVVVFSILLFLPVNAYTDTSFSITYKLNPGKVGVSEKIVFSLDDDAEERIFSQSLRLGRSTISDWRRYSQNVDYHVHGSLVFVNSTRIVAKRDASLPGNPAVVVVEYEVNPDILIKEVKSSRVTEYALNESLLSLDRLRTGEIVLETIDELVFEISEGSRFSNVRPDPDVSMPNSVSFKGPLSGKFAVSFIEEKTLSREVNEFFVETYSNAANLIPLLLLLALLVFLWFKLVS